MLNRKTAIDIVKDFVFACNQQNIRFKKVILFGSVARNEAHKYSDIDVALVSEQFSGNPYSDWASLSPVKVKNIKFIDIEPHPYSVKDFKNSDPFIEEIKRTGVEIKI